MSRPLIILATVVLVLNAVLGAGRGGITMCVGHAHDTGHHADHHTDHHTNHQADHCGGRAVIGHGERPHAGCDPAGWHLHLADHADCCCHDVDLPAPDLVFLPALAGPPTITAGAALAGPRMSHAALAVPRWRGPPRDDSFDPAREHRLAIVRSTRLII